MLKKTEELLESHTAAEVITKFLTEPEVKGLRSIKHELNSCIRWGKVVEEALPPLLDSVSHLITHNGSSVKRIPFEALFEHDQELLTSDTKKSRLMLDYVLCLLTKKLLVALTTKVNQTLSNFPTLDEEVLNELEEEISREEDESLTRFSREFSRKESFMKVSEEARNMRVIASIRSGGDTGCEHIRTTVHLVKKDKSKSGKPEVQEFCKDCRRTIRTDILTASTERRRGKFEKVARRLLRETGPCSHPSVEWKMGEEGKVAICTSCQEVASNPGKYQWESVGLEPFGDDPDEDEILVIPVGAETRKEKTA